MLSLTVTPAFASIFVKYPNPVSTINNIPDLRRIRRHISLYTAKIISTQLIRSHLVYCKSLLNNIAKRGLHKLQRVQHCLARVVLRALRFSPSLPLLTQLHWLPVTYRIHFKQSTLTYRALSTQQPPTCLVSCIFQISVGNSYHPFHNNLLFPKLNLTCFLCRSAQGLERTSHHFENI